MKVVCLLLICAIVALVTAGGVGNSQENTEDKKNKKPETTGNKRKGASKFNDELKDLFQKHIDLSLKYLYTSSGYGNQRVQRPGMAKHLLELSNSHWEEGINTLKKFFKRGGNATDIYDKKFFEFHGKNELNMTIKNTTDMREPYLKTLKDLEVDSKDCTTILNKLHHISVGKKQHDADWGHYFEEKLEEEEERKRELAGHVTSWEKMNGSSLALHVFDSNL